jgi:hypothetical protein
MSFLTPLYALGVLAVAAPIVFHLIRRTPRGEVPFSSLMFLAPTPPRLTRRSRLDQVVLLLLRAAALCLLALAFTRPFWRQAADVNFGAVERRRVAVVIDTSASMRRGSLWTRARTLADEVIADSRPGDELAVFAFDVTSRPVLSFAESATLDPARRRAVARARLGGLAPSWGGTHLGQALIDAVAAIEDVADASEKTGRMPRRVVLIGDLQQGSRIDVLGDFEWPSDVELDLKTVADDGANAGLHGLAEVLEAEPSRTGTGTGTGAGAGAEAGKGAGPELRVRVSNDTGSRDAFELHWVDSAGGTAGKPVDVYVPPGESRVVRVPRPQGSTPQPLPLRALRLTGDAQPFDNTLFVRDERRQEATVVALTADRADDPAGLLYYLERVFQDTPRRTVRVAANAPSAPLSWEGGPAPAPALVVLAGETTPANVDVLKKYARDGGTVLDVRVGPGRAEALAALAGVAPWDISEGAVDRDVMLGAIAFDHPLFASMAAAQFNDFTKIHFWQYRKIDPQALGDDVRVVARFENGDPAVLEKVLGRGRLVVLASGWQPADSQLARSSKFVPLMTALLEAGNPRLFDAGSYQVGDRVPLAASASASAAGSGPSRGPVVHKPDGTTETLAAGETSFAATDQPGVYTVDPAQSFVVNLDPQESKTSPLHVETLEQFGCRLANPSRKLADQEHLRQMQNAELENRQKLWRWLVLALIGVLIVETWLAGRLTRARSARVEALVP